MYKKKTPKWSAELTWFAQNIGYNDPTSTHIWLSPQPKKTSPALDQSLWVPQTNRPTKTIYKWSDMGNPYKWPRNKWVTGVITVITLLGVKYHPSYNWWLWGPPCVKKNCGPRSSALYPWNSSLGSHPDPVDMFEGFCCSKGLARKSQNSEYHMHIGFKIYTTTYSWYIKTVWILSVSIKI